MNLDTMRKVALGNYGVSRFGDEDPLWNYHVLNDIINREHKWLAERVRCYRQTQTYDITADTSYVNLECNVIDLDPEKVRAYVSAEWRELTLVAEEDLRRSYGPLENQDSGDPLYYYLRLGDAVEAQRVLEMFPTPQTTALNGLKVAAYIYPADLSADTDAPALQVAEHNHLIPCICRGMAEVDLNRGRPDAPALVAHWTARAERAAEDLKRIMERAARPGIRRVRYETDTWDTGYLV